MIWKAEGKFGTVGPVSTNGRALVSGPLGRAKESVTGDLRCRSALCPAKGSGLAG